MATKDNERPLPKFGEWDVNDPASAEGYSVIFTRARDDKKRGGSSRSETYSNKTDDSKHKDKHDFPKKRKWLCWGPSTKI